MNDYVYVGNELEVFSHARNWKSYFAARLGPYIAGDVLEVGAGVGGTTRHLCRGTERSWSCLEPDAALAQKLIEEKASAPFPLAPEVFVGTLAAIPAERQFDTILYIDVLEHIEDDAAELRAAAAHLRLGGRVIVLSPAYQFLYSPFDKAIGHYRRYCRKTLLAPAPQNLALEKLFYLDGLGMMLSLANRMLLRSASPSVGQVQFWDRFVIPCSRVIDPLTGFSFGRSIIGVWRRIAE